MKKISIEACVVMVFGVSVLAGCAQGQSTLPPTKLAGMANPASVYCQKMGGVSQSYETKDGVAANCTLPDGTVIDEWELYRRDHAPGTGAEGAAQGAPVHR